MVTKIHCFVVLALNSEIIRTKLITDERLMCCACGVGSKRLLGSAVTPVTHQQSNTDQQMSFRNR